MSQQLLWSIKQPSTKSSDSTTANQVRVFGPNLLFTYSKLCLIKSMWYPYGAMNKSNIRTSSDGIRTLYRSNSICWLTWPTNHPFTLQPVSTSWWNNIDWPGTNSFTHTHWTCFIICHAFKQHHSFQTMHCYLY